MGLKFIAATLLTLWLNSQTVSAEFRIITEHESTISNLPSVSWVYHMDAASGYFGVIIDSQRVFQLFSEHGEVVFTARAEEPYRYFTVRMREHPGLIVLGSMVYGGGGMSFDVYDFNGNQIVSSLKTDNVLRASPSGSYYYSVSDYGENNGRPQIFDSGGNVLHTFDLGSKFWEMTAIDDSTILLQDRFRLMIVSVPDLVTKYDFSLNDGHRRPPRLVTSLSRDGSTYAFTTHEDIAILDLKTGTFAFIAKEGERIRLTSQFALSYDGEFLTTFRSSSKGQKVDVYRRIDKTYRKVVDSYYLPTEYDGSQGTDAVFLMNKYCGITFYLDRNGFLEHKTFLFQLPDSNQTELDWRTLEGFISFDTLMNVSHHAFRLISAIHSSSSILRIEGSEE